MAKKTTKASAAAPTNQAEPINDAELAHPSTDGYENSAPHKHGDPHPRNKRKTGDSAHQLSAAEVAELHGADVIAANEAKAREIRAKQRAG